MKLIGLLCLSFLGVICLPATPVTAHTNQVRLPIHAFTNPDSGWGLGAWVINPNFLGGRHQYVLLAGPRRAGKNRWIEYLGGVKVETDSTWWLADLRFGVGGPGQLHLFGNPQVMSRQLDALLDADYPIRQGKKVLAKVGLETEAVIRTDAKPVWVIGPHLVLPFGKQFSLAAAYHFRRGENVLRVYLPISFSPP